MSHEQSRKRGGNRGANLGGLVLGLAHWNFEFVSDFPLALAFGFWPAPGCALCVTKV